MRSHGAGRMVAIPPLTAVVLALGVVAAAPEMINQARQLQANAQSYGFAAQQAAATESREAQP